MYICLVGGVKVIYHLNTKNEDHQIEIDSMAANHQMEVQQILRDAASKISKFKELVETKQQAVSASVFKFIYFIFANN